MNINELFPPDLYRTPPPRQPFDEMLSAAWRVWPLPPVDVTKLADIKRAWCSDDGFCLTDKTLAWLTKLARKGGWRKERQHA